MRSTSRRGGSPSPRRATKSSSAPSSPRTRTRSLVTGSRCSWAATTCRCASSASAIDPEYLYAMQSEGTLPAPGTFAIVYTTEQGIEHLFGTSHSGNGVVVKAEPGVNLEDLAEEVEDELRPYGLDSTAQRDDMPSYGGLKSELEQNRLMARSMPALDTRDQLDVAVHRAVAARPGPTRRDRTRQGAGLQRQADTRPLPDHRDDGGDRRVGTRRRAGAVGGAGRGRACTCRCSVCHS